MDETHGLIEHKPAECGRKAARMHDISQHLWQHLGSIMLRSIVQEAVSLSYYMPPIDFEENTCGYSVLTRQ